MKSDGIQLPNVIVIKSLEGESYKSLGALEADEVMVNEWKMRWRKSTKEEWKKCWKQS